MAILTQAKQIKKNNQGPIVIDGFSVATANITATTISFADSNPDTINDSGSGLGVFATGQVIEVSGSTSNDGTYTIASVAAGSLTLDAGDSLTVESAGASVTITVVGEDISSDLSTAASTGGNNGTAVTHEASTAFNDDGWVVTASDNFTEISDDTSKRALSDSNGKEIFARITEASSVYTIRYYTLVSGTETPHAFTSAQTIKIIALYNFELDDLPNDARSRRLNARLREDPPGADVPNFAEAETLTPTADDTLPALANTPLSGAKVTLIINSETYLEDVHFTRSGTAITWTFTKGSPNFGFTLKTTDDVHAYYRY